MPATAGDVVERFIDFYALADGELGAYGGVEDNDIAAAGGVGGEDGGAGRFPDDE